MTTRAVSARSPWWSVIDPGTHKSVIVIQFDLKGHTAWGAAQDTDYEPAEWRREFATALQSKLVGQKFDRLFWAGDGGAFARLHEGSTEDADAAVRAADQAFNVFNRFRHRVTHGAKLSLRASATCIEAVLHPDASYWYGPALNEFLKHERDIGLPDAFIITLDLRRKLSRQIIDMRFPTAHEVPLSSQDRISVFTDTQHPYTPSVSGKRFTDWLIEHKSELPNSTKTIYSSADPRQVIVGNMVIWDSALTETGYSKIKLNRVDFDAGQLDKRLQFVAEEWNKLKAAASDVSGIKASPRLVYPGLTDSTELEIDLAQVPYRIIHTFHQLMFQNEKARSELISEALRLQEDRVIPGSLCAHAALVFGTRGDRYLLLAHRAKNKAGYYDNRWSASFEEQFAAVKSFWGKRVHEADTDLTSTVTRGLKEEFLGDDFTGPMHVRLHAVGIELDNLNIDLLAVVDLPGTTFADIEGRWARALDSKEHDMLVAIPLNKQVLMNLLHASALTNVSISHRCGADDEAVLSAPWHPASPARLAMCAWLLEQGLI